MVALQKLTAKKTFTSRADSQQDIFFKVQVQFFCSKAGWLARQGGIPPVQLLLPLG
jgi:hypothetical protein